MNWLQRSVAAALLIFPIFAGAQTVRRPDWQLYGNDRVLTHGDDWADAKPLFFYYLNPEISQLSDGHLLVATRNVRAAALKPLDADSKERIRRRAELRIAQGYDSALARLLATNEEIKALIARNEKLANAELADARRQTLYEIDCEYRMLRTRRLDRLQSWQDAPPDTSLGALVTLACSAAGPRSRG